MAQRKENKAKIKVRDLKPKKDAKGGVVANVNTSNQSRYSFHQGTQNQNVNQTRIG